ncbi:MAG: triphosphoribosyl-dephospho-CoA synthase, partial [Bacteroidales bacterium]|nr:triphosphoribosyl-dephospho-CoA synthase [Bacteroidales bacterium]
SERYQALCGAFLDELKVEVLPGTPYAISAATFPSYFLKEPSDAATAQMELDLDLFARHLAPALGATVRYVGTEADDALTAQYNDLMARILPPQGIEVVAVPRLEEGGRAIRASQVRQHIAEGNFTAADSLSHPESMPMLLRALAERALLAELDLPGKPGLVCPESRGAHNDMDYALMRKSIAAIVPYIHAFASINPDDDVAADMIETGMKAEKAMLAATGGVNTHRGAIFALGVAATAFAQVYWEGETVTEKAWRGRIAGLASAVPTSKTSHGARAAKQYKVKGALQNAREGYPQLFKEWLPYYRRIKGTQDALLKLLLRIIADLDDTNILYRKGPAAAAKAKTMAADCLNNLNKLTAMDSLFVREGLSPGGSADMLALTIFADCLMPNTLF